MVQLDDEAVDTVVRIGGAVEAGRRVGWAKAFEALRRADSAEYDVNILRGDVKMLSNMCARIFGSLQVTVGRNRMNELMRGDHHELQGYLPQGPLNMGRDAMHKLLGDRRDELNEIRAQIENAKTERHWLGEKAVKSIRAKQLVTLMEEYGIPNEDELRAWLDNYPKGEVAEDER
jgi:hypothetical protein